MSPHQSLPLCHKVPDKAQDWSAVRINCYVVHTQATYCSHTGVDLSNSERTMKRVSGYDTAKYYATAHSSYLSRSCRSCSWLHGSPPTCRIGLPPDKNVGHPSLVNLPVGRDDPPDKEITYNCMNGSPGDPPGSFVHQSKQQKNRSFHNPSRGRSIRQGGRLGDNYRRYITCH
jgi:hypothetical protein